MKSVKPPSHDGAAGGPRPGAAPAPSWKSQALPIAAGAVVSIAALYFLIGGEPPPRTRGAPSASATATQAPATSGVASAAPGDAALKTAVVASSAAAPSTAASAAAVPPSPSLPAPGERTVRAQWQASGRQRAPNAVGPASACTLEATVAAAAEGALALRGLTVQCAGKTLYEVSSLPAGATSSVEERPALERGSFVYALRYRDERAEIDTLRGRAVVDVTAPVIGAAWLVVANESGAVKERLLAATPDEKALPGNANERLGGRVTNVTGDSVVAREMPCVLAFSPYGPADGAGRCDVFVQCGPVTVIGQPEAFSAKCTRRSGKIVAAVDGEAEPTDDDPGLLMDEHSAKMWNGANGARWLVNVALEAPK